jgi:hypothetical protein
MVVYLQEIAWAAETQNKDDSISIHWVILMRFFIGMASLAMEIS